MADVKEKALLFDRLKQEIKAGDVNLTLRQAQYSTNNKHQRCNCEQDCGGTWLYPNPTSVEEHLKVDNSWIPCVALIKRFQKKSRSRRERYDRLQGLFAAYGKDVKKTKETDAAVNKRVVSHLVERLINYHAARNSAAWWEFLFPWNHYGRAQSFEEPRPETDRREAGANVPITSLVDQTERNFVKAEYSADDEEEVSSIRPSHSGAGENSFTQREDREKAHSSWMDFFRRRENTESVDYSSFIIMPNVTEKALLFDALKQEIKNGNVNLTLRKAESSSGNKQQRCNCEQDCGGTWRYPSPTSVEEHLKVDNSWIPCIALIKRFQENTRSRRERYVRLQSLFAAFGKDVKKTIERDAATNERVVSHLVERRINYDAARNSGEVPLIRPNYLENNHFAALWDFLFPGNDYGRAHSSEEHRPETDRREAGANVPEEIERNFEEAEYSADDDEVSSIRSSHSGASQNTFTQQDDRERVNSSWTDFFRRRENSEEPRPEANQGEHYSADDEEVSSIRSSHSGASEDSFTQSADRERAHSSWKDFFRRRENSEEPRPEADRRETGMNVPIISLLEENERNFGEAEYSADDEEVSFDSTVCETSFPQRDDRERDHSSSKDFFRRRENSEDASQDTGERDVGANERLPSPLAENERNFEEAHYSADDEEVSFIRSKNFETDHSVMHEDSLHQRIDYETTNSVRENFLRWREKSEEPCPGADENSLYQDSDSETACLKEKSRDETDFLSTVIILLCLDMLVSIFLFEFLT